MMDVDFGGIWTPIGFDMMGLSTWTLAFGGPKHRLLILDVMREARV
jgi:hypothetical protein